MTAGSCASTCEVALQAVPLRGWGRIFTQQAKVAGIFNSSASQDNVIRYLQSTCQVLSMVDHKSMKSA